MKKRIKKETSHSNMRFIIKAHHKHVRVSEMYLQHGKVKLPIFMPVGTKGSLKGLTAAELSSLGCRLFLGNTYHLHNNPGADFLASRGGLHKFIGWKHNLLTDSGGFQMVSLSRLCTISEEGVHFRHPHTDQPMFLRPEDSIKAQTGIGADIIMALDDVVSSTITGPRVEEACDRTLRWLDRCLNAHANSKNQNLFPIVQGGLNEKLRKKCLEEMKSLPVTGFAIGGLSGGEKKTDFIRVVAQCCRGLPEDKPRYLMGVGFPVDVLICTLLGVDMFDCVYPTRTARFGTALTHKGILKLKSKEFSDDFQPIMIDCPCEACKNYTRAFLHTIVCKEEVACHLLTKHNITYLLRLMENVRKEVIHSNVEKFVDNYLETFYSGRRWPQWVRDGLRLANFEKWQGEILLEDHNESIKDQNS